MPLLIPYAAPASTAAVTPSYDNSGVSGYEYQIASGTAFTWTQNATAGAYAIATILVANAAGLITLSPTSYLVTFGGTTMTSLGSVYFNNNATAAGWLWVFGLPSAPGGSPATVSAKFTQAGDVFDGYGVSFTYLNVSSVGSLVTQYGYGTAQTLSVPSASGNLVWGIQGGDSALSAFSMDHTRQSEQIGYPYFIAGDSAGAASVAVNATQASGYSWGAAGLNLI